MKGHHTSRASVWPMVIIPILAFALAGGLGFLYFNRRANADPAVDAISGAQQAVTDARARIESLPKDHPLYNQLGQLLQWQGELNGYAAVPQKTAEMNSRAQLIEQKASQLSEQARSALAAVTRKPATMPSPSPTTGIAASASSPAVAETGASHRAEGTNSASRAKDDETAAGGESEARKEKSGKEKNDVEEILEDVVKEAQKKARPNKQPPELPEVAPADPNQQPKKSPPAQDGAKKADQPEKRPDPPKLPDSRPLN